MTSWLPVSKIIDDNSEFCSEPAMQVEQCKAPAEEPPCTESAQRPGSRTARGPDGGPASLLPSALTQNLCEVLFLTNIVTTHLRIIS